MNNTKIVNKKENSATGEALSFDPKKITTNLLASLPPRSRQIIKKRYGLEAKQPMTLEAVGQIYGITRERVRQIEEFTLKAIKKDDSFTVATPVFTELKTVLQAHGGIVHEREFLNQLTGDLVVQNNIHFLLVLGDAFTKLREDDNFHKRWTIDMAVADAVHQSLKNLARKLSINDLLTEEEIIND